ncbi:MAG TPA: anhydro-N-acetylmuramic acid kinase, partial [Gammaproteobacteria bacterium]|nr:anhydro-N-acetylmuramic acid kinase [Gammaproteobacteria bacterium]
MTGAYYLGLMSGTSMDGIDAALLDLSNGEARLLA